MKKIVLSTIVATVLATNIMAEIKPYIGVGFNSFNITNSNLSLKDPSIGYNSTSTEVTSDGGTAVGLNGGIILTDNTKINVFHFSGKESDSSVMTTTVTGISYDYSFNNKGIHRGWYLGAGFSSVKVKFDETRLSEASSQSSTGLLLKGGYEYKTDNNLLWDIGFTSNLAEQDHNYKMKNSNGTTSDTATWSSTTSVSNLNISVNYLF